MPRLTPCPACHAHVMSDERSCPHCGEGLRPTANKGAVVLMGLALAGCPSAGEPEYGVPVTTTDSDSNTSTDGTAGTAETSGGTGGEMTTAEPEYGVPETGEPDYGVPVTTGDTGGTSGA